MRGHAPERLFADEPHAVDDLVGKPALAFEALGDHQVLELPAAAVADRLVAGAVAVAAVFQEQGGGEQLPSGFELLLAGLEECSARIGGKGLPSRPVGGRGERMGSNQVFAILVAESGGAVVLMPPVDLFRGLISGRWHSSLSTPKGSLSSPEWDCAFAHSGWRIRLV